METKLTLRLDDGVIERAKRYASERGISVSQLVASYFDLLTSPDMVFCEPAGGPVTRRLHGLLEGSGLDESDYRAHLEEKYG